MKKRGFTLIELIAVVAIIAILAAVILPNVFGQIRKGRVSRNLAEAGDLKTGSLQYFADVGAWPTGPGTDDAIDQLITNPVGVANWRGPYMDKAPRTRADGRYATQYGGCLMLNDIDTGDGDDATADDNGDGMAPDRFVYLGLVPSRDAQDTDIAVDGQINGTPGAGGGYVIGRNANCNATDPNPNADCYNVDGDWPADPDARCTVEIIITSGQ
ncbi:MAG: prepilin-type N-terminal cleavage/methylation domain-containing protein [bacterium JZ-2024 1]